MKTILILVLVAAARAATYSRHSLNRLAAKPAPAPAPAPGPATGPAPGPAPGPAAGAAAVTALRVTFEIKNYNYYDLTKQTCPTVVEEEETVKASPEKTQKAADSGYPSIGKAVKEIGQHVGDVTAGATDAPPWMEKEGGESGASFLATGKAGACVIQHNSLAAIHSKSNECKTVMDVFRSALTEIVKEVIKCMASEPAPKAPAAAPQPPGLVPLPPQPKFFLQSIQQAAPAPAAPADGPPDAAIHVTFLPGKEVGHGRSVIVEITLTDTPSNGLDDVALTKAILERALALGFLKKELKTGLEIVTGLRPKLGKVKIETVAVEGWDVKKCEGHVKNIVQQFSHHYTREQVPMAMFNECTNFMTRISFSHDHVLDPVDTLVCRKTTASFAKHWNYGEKAKDEDFQLMCVTACEAKFGKKAPRCNVEAGDKLAGKPLL